MDLAELVTAVVAGTATEAVADTIFMDRTPTMSLTHSHTMDRKLAEEEDEAITKVNRIYLSTILDTCMKTNFIAQLSESFIWSECVPCCPVYFQFKV